LAGVERRRNLLSVQPETKRIGILGFDGVATLDLAGPLKAFTTALTDADTEKPRGCYDILVVGLKAKSFVSDSNLIVTATESLAKTGRLDTVLVPGGPGLRDSDTIRRISEWLRTNADDLTRIVAVGTGIYAVAQSGLLVGRKVTTHWRCAQDVARRFPNIRVDQAASFLKDGPFYSCSGGTAATELTLALIEEDYGSRIALSVAKELCLRLRPFGDLADTLDPVQFECGPNDRLAELPSWIAGHLHHDLSVEALAGRTCLCPRHFSRLFKRAFRSSPANFVEARRLDEAKRQLLRARGSIVQQHACTIVQLAQQQRRPGIALAATRRTFGSWPSRRTTPGRAGGSD
jgi:transcriptional regulator GlxA family with amidase domain